MKELNIVQYTTIFRESLKIQIPTAFIKNIS